MLPMCGNLTFVQVEEDMFIHQPIVEHPMPVLKEEDQILRNGFSICYQKLAILHENRKGIQRYFSGMLMPYQNAVMGYPDAFSEWDLCIEEELKFFKAADRRFVWYVDESAPQAFKMKLLARGFTNQGVLKGVMGPLDSSIPEPRVPEGYSLELVQDEEAMREFNELVCSTFGIAEQDQKRFQSIHWENAQSFPPLMYHWIVRKETQVVSTLTTLITGDLVSFWNGATLPEERKKGLSTALRSLALKRAAAQGCTLGSSYLMSDGMAFGICSKLGFKTRWRFEAFLSPSD